MLLALTALSTYILLVLVNAGGVPAPLLANNQPADPCPKKAVVLAAL